MAEPPFVGVLVDFVHELRAEELPVGSGDLLTFCAAMRPLDPTDLQDLYWAGRTTLVTRREQIPRYDRVFRRYFLGEDDAGGPTSQPVAAAASSAAVLEIPLAEPAGDDEEADETELGLVASDVEVLRTKAFVTCSPEELAAVRRMIARLDLTPPRRRTRRTRPAADGTRPDLRRTLREAMRRHGEPTELRWRRRRHRVRPLVLLLDVSGSMADWSRNLLQFAYAARRSNARVEVFCFGTRLTRITRALDRRRADDAMAEAAATVQDWEGGTRIGDAVTAFVRGWGRRGVARGGIVVICSDGFDRGDPEVLEQAMERLHRLCHRVVWVNPHQAAGGADHPTSLGLMAAAPHVDLFRSGRDLADLEAFAAGLPDLR